MNRPGLHIATARDESGALTLRIVGELDMLSAPELSRVVEEGLRERPGRIVLDLGGVTFCDSLGLGTLMLLNRRITAARSVLVLTNVSGNLLRTLDITGLRSLLTVR
ncbi:anti-sigma factor antagonist [Pilimelia anulata]|uniref:Anti-sigma factor antagonist n=1 Tax=Pilimelia anulata TaxID=53371 RepID=A0A8J3B5G0_9ACTN|nr:STAS domain-containing protein [Pilimelia anulata]GGJ95037.1 anti-sigma factor antagonist [Pilimelia anulata]